VANLHVLTPLILAPSHYVRWLGDEPDAHELMRPFPAERCRCEHFGEINKPENTIRRWSRSRRLLAVWRQVVDDGAARRILRLARRVIDLKPIA
jgi:hypothetical protein